MIKDSLNEIISCDWKVVSSNIQQPHPNHTFNNQHYQNNQTNPHNNFNYEHLRQDNNYNGNQSQISQRSTSRITADMSPHTALYTN